MFESVFQKKKNSVGSLQAESEHDQDDPAQPIQVIVQRTSGA